MVVILIALRAEAEGWRDIGDARRVEIRLENAGAYDVVSLRGQPARNWLVGGIAQCKDNPARIGAGRLGRYGHPSHDPVRARRRFDAEFVAPAFVKFAKKRYVDLFVAVTDDNGLDC